MKLRPLPRSADTGGLTAGHGVIVRLDCTRNLRLLTHEFVHIAQYERLGREGFLQEYIQQLAAHGYPRMPLSNWRRKPSLLKQVVMQEFGLFLNFP